MYNFESYAEMRNYLGELFANEQFQAAAELLEWAIEQFPAHLHANAYNLAFIRASLNQAEQSLRALQQGLESGVWYGRFDFEHQAWEAVKALEAFQEIREQSQAREAEAQKGAQVQWEVSTPKAYDPQNHYPLFIALHGGGENLEVFRPNWQSATLTREFIVLYVQSSRVISMTGFGWFDLATAKSDILQAYEHTSQNYAIDPAEIMVGGFSMGGKTAIGMVLDETLNARGFVALCPQKPDNFNHTTLAKASTRGIRGTLLSTEMDPRLSEQEEMVVALKAAGILHQFVVTPNIGHWYPEDFASKLDQAIAHIRKT